MLRELLKLPLSPKDDVCGTLRAHFETSDRYPGPTTPGAESRGDAVLTFGVYNAAWWCASAVRVGE